MRNITIRVMQAAILIAAVVGILTAASPAQAVMANVLWNNPTTMTDNSAISATDQAKIVATVYLGSSSTGPWSVIGTGAPGATALTTGELNLTRGSTYWFTADWTLAGKTSAKAAPMSATYDYGTPNPGTMIQIIIK